MSSNLSQDRVRWPGSGSNVTSDNLPFGYYLSEICDSDESSFENDCSSSAMWAAKRLGYPIVDIEMIDDNFYTCFEESVLEYNRIINEFNIVNNITDLQGLPQSEYKNLLGLSVRGTGLPYNVELSKQYGSEAMVGGDVEVYKDYIDITGSTSSNINQTFDLNELFGDKIHHLTGSRIEGMSYSNVLQEMGFAGYSPATQFLMTPIFEDLERIQAIEFNDTIRKSQYSFEVLGNNKLKIFPIPTRSFKLYIEYTIDSDKNITNFKSGSNYEYISDPSDVPYETCTYCKINQAGKQWIKKYFLALCKETLGRILQKYSTVPIPGGEVTLDGAELRNEANEEKNSLQEILRDLLEKTLRTSQLENKSKESENTNKMLSYVPVKIYIG
jgi:hypothetical protein